MRSYEATIKVQFKAKDLDDARKIASEVAHGEATVERLSQVESVEEIGRVPVHNRNSYDECGIEFKRRELGNAPSTCGRRYGHEGEHSWYSDCNLCPGEAGEHKPGCYLLMTRQEREERARR